MQRLTLHVPETLNDGSRVPNDVFEGYEDDLLDIALESKLSSGAGEEGFTLARNVVGVWRSPSGNKHKEFVRLYWLDVADSAPIRDLVLHLADRIKGELAQEAVYVTIGPIDVTLVTEHAVA